MILAEKKHVLSMFGQSTVFSLYPGPKALLSHLTAEWRITVFRSFLFLNFLIRDDVIAWKSLVVNFFYLMGKNVIVGANCWGQAFDEMKPL